MSDYENSTPPAAGSGSDDNTIAMLVHLSGIILGFIVPLIMWLVNKDNPQKSFLTDQSKEALNFQITVSLAVVVSFLLMLVVIGFFLLGLVSVGALVLTIIAGIKANEGLDYRYPFTWRPIK